jgi:hypothetical protein
LAVPSFLKKVAPFISMGLSATGPLGAMAGNALTSALGAKPGSSVTSVIASLTTTPPTPDQIAALQKQENDFKMQMATLQINSIEELEKTIDEDIASARQRETDMAKAGARDNTPKWLAALAALMAATVSILLISGHSAVLNSPTSAAMAGTVLGYVFNDLKQVYSYYFGSSKGSDDKSATIADIAKS